MYNIGNVIVGQFLLRGLILSYLPLCVFGCTHSMPAPEIVRSMPLYGLFILALPGRGTGIYLVFVL